MKYDINNINIFLGENLHPIKSFYSNFRFYMDKYRNIPEHVLLSIKLNQILVR